MINNRKIYYQRFLSLILNIESMDWKKIYINVKIILKYFFPVKHYLPRNTQGLIAIVVWNISVYLYTSKEICIFMCTYIHMYLVDTPDLDNLKSSDLERHSITIWKWSRSCISTVLFRMNIQFAVESDFPWRERMSSRRHRVSTKRLCACVRAFMRLCRIFAKRGGIHVKERGWIGNGITAESGFTQFDSFAVREICTRTYKRHRARTHLCTHAWSSASRYRESAGAVRYGRKSFIYSFTIGPKKRGKYSDL